MARSAVLQRQGGRRIKKVPKGKRTQIGVIVGGKTKALLLKAMQESGRTISREAEYLIEKALAYDSMLAAMRTTLAEMEKGNVGPAMHRQGFRPKHTPWGPLYYPAGHPEAPPASEFSPNKDESK